ncbi:MAG: 50S ribosomal protein L25 [Bacteroidales bacterium]|nr:50S ribosomal protein L25 [Bacteroidales bacterium]
MKTFQLTAEPRTDLGKKAAKALRKDNKIPVVLNGGAIVDLPYEGKLREGEKVVVIDEGKKKGLITTDLVVSQDAVRKLVYTPDIFAIELNVHGEKRMAVLKDLQFHPVKDTILHMDLLEVNEDKPVTIEVPVQLEGHAEGVKAGGKLTLSMKKIRVKAPYTRIPERVVINVDSLGLGKTLQIGDLHFEGLELMNAKNAVVCAVQLTRAARGAAAAAAAATK